ncbi:MULTISPECIES: ABC transporter substrate-binding protein [Pseudomonas]|uniref:ABC transporter substrate-binding protein n=2 Tax=Pseudomonas TaxID=286 RepID=A0A423J6X2_9PSED|nr:MULTISPECIES: ABC transporter substrate-binding protein [Pseudomonas]EJM01081.1 periplasmic component of amino acid ABC-type transporter/signal transduction system [Pseudomonas sp. GM102]KZN19902.1 ABC transporter substrate-binding protein [Pseudomonas fluorescens]MBD9562066.1 ABC transporter substrate-binding protein [Pseudomonas sp. PDM09]MBV7493732.1 ABC transporter substrate-binding protein [Pseudomonas sp. PDM24]RON33440.1 ABC transporter substrate-binding protein [Pseudomonas frederik
MKNIVIPAVLAGVMASSFTWAAELPASIKDKGEVVVAIMPNYPPMDFKDPATNTLTGLDVDLGNALAERLGVKIKWQETGFEQMINALTTDRVDMVMSGMTDTAERQASVTFVDYFTSGPQFYTLQKNKDTNEIIDLCGKKVGTSRRTTFPAEIAEWSKANCEAAGKPAINVIGTEGSADARAQLRQSRIDAAMQGSETLPYLKTQEKDMYKTVGLPISKQFTGLGVSKKKPELSEAVKVAMQSMVDDGSYQAILKKWDLELGAIKTVTINAGK